MHGHELDQSLGPNCSKEGTLQAPFNLETRNSSDNISCQQADHPRKGRVDGWEQHCRTSHPRRCSRQQLCVGPAQAAQAVLQEPRLHMAEARPAPLC
eukprot:1158073-Pelagomonas_calceolata.AAC.2